MNGCNVGSWRNAAAVVMLMGFRVWGSVPAAPGDAPVTAVWYTQTLEFHFSSRSLSVAYSCESFKTKLVAILKSVGVHSSLALSCSGNGLARYFEVRLQVQNALEATAANVAAATEFDATRRLLARFKGEQLPTAADIPRFEARWQRIDLHRERKLNLRPGDCELLQQVRDQLFPKLSISVERDGLNCKSGNAARMNRPLQVVALLPQKGRDTAASQTEQM